MAVQQTIAIVGAAEKLGAELTNKLAKQHYRLLLVSDNKEQLNERSASAQQLVPQAEIEVVECTKDGCWEADTIILTVPATQLNEVAEVIKEVSTQKVVINISAVENDASFISAPIPGLQKLLPHARVIQALVNVKKGDCVIAGYDDEAVAEAVAIIGKAGYNTVVANNVSRN